MLSAIQQTPLPLDPTRQQTAPVPIPPSTPVTGSAAPGPQAPPDSQQDPDYERRNQARQDQIQDEATSKLKLAWARLVQLQQTASQALRSGNTELAKEVAMEATQVATSIGEMTSSLPGLSTGGADSPPDQAHSADIPAVLETARSGLTTAGNVIDMASSLPDQPVENRAALNDMRRQVLESMASVEATAASFAAKQPQAAAAAGHFDMTA